MSASLSLSHSSHGNKDTLGNALYRGELCLTETEFKRLSSSLEELYRFELVQSPADLLLCSAAPTPRSSVVGLGKHTGKRPSSSVAANPQPTPKRLKTAVEAPVSPLTGWRHLISSEVFARLQQEPDIAHWLWTGGASAAELPDGLGLQNIHNSLPVFQSHFEVQAEISAFLDAILRDTPPSHALYAVAWKTRRLATELFRPVLGKIDNSAYFATPLPELPAESPETASSLKGGAGGRNSAVDAGAKLLARLSALEAQIAGLQRGGGGGGQANRGLSAQEIERLETDIGQLPDDLLERMVSEKLRNTTGLRWEGEGADRTAVVEVANLDAKNQRILRKWVTQQLVKKPLSAGTAAGGAGEEKARAAEERVERMLEQRRRREEQEVKEESVELARLRELERQAEEAKRYIDMMVMDGGGSDDYYD